MTSSVATTERKPRPSVSDRVEVCPGQVAAELDDVAAALGRLRDTEWWRWDDAEVLAAAQRVEATLRSGFGVQIRLAREIDSREMTAWTGHRSTAGLLSEMLRIPLGQARGRLDAARLGVGFMTLSGGAIPAAVPELLAAIDDGSISDEHVVVVTKCLDGIPMTVPGETVSMCRQLLLAEAKQRNPVALRTVAEQIRLICDDAGAPPGPDPVDRAELHFGALRSDGLTPIRGLLDPLTAEQLRVAVEALAAPAPIDDNTPDPRPAGVRRAQALSQVLARYFAAGCSGGGGPGVRSVRPVVAVTVPAYAPPCRAGGVGPADHDARGHAGSVAGGAFGAAGDGKTGAAGGGRASVVAAGPRATASVSGRFDYGSPASARSVDLLACDGILIRQIIGQDGAVLDQGRAQRLFTRAQRRALITRDGGCAFPGCDIPAGWCEAHHITPWSEDGPTDLSNGVLLCRRHHTVIHQGRWRIDRDVVDRGRPWFIPPAHIDFERTPRRNHHFQLSAHVQLPAARVGVMRT